ncbi:MAG: RNA polymerase factor sigma-54 [Kiritimatiellia bacterium]
MSEIVQSISTGLRQHQAQEQTLSLQAQQRLALLQLPLIALEQSLRIKAEQNPFLEYETPLQTESLDEVVDRVANEEDEATSLDYFNENLEGFGDQRDPNQQDESLRRYDYMMMSQTEPVTLYRHLAHQAELLLPAGERREQVLLICDALDADGYLRTPLQNLQDAWFLIHGLPAKENELRDAIRTVQTFDPVGVGARSLSECLELQVRADSRYQVERGLWLRLCRQLGRVVSDSPEKLAKILRCSTDELRNAIAHLRTLNPFPGRQFAPPNSLETPEIIALQEADGHWKAFCDERLFPLFRVDNLSVIKAREAARTKEEKMCVADLEAKAQLWVDAYHERNDTLCRVAQLIFDQQGDFLSSGGDSSKLHPLLQRDIATAIGYDESTVSRAIKEKFVRVATCSKPLPLKSFFTHALPSYDHDGDEVSDQQAKGALRALVEMETTPLSDQALTEALMQQGITLARRTVTKYRKQLGILSTRDRQQKHTKGSV